MPVLPSMKTPGLSRHKSRLAKVDEASQDQPNKEIETDTVVDVLSQPCSSEQQTGTQYTTPNKSSRNESAEQPRDCRPFNLEAPSTVVQEEMKQVEIVDVAIADVTNVQRSTRVSTVKKSAASRGKSGRGGVKQSKRLNKRNTECESNDEENKQSNKRLHVALSSDDDFIIEAPRQKSKRLTRSKAKKLNADDVFSCSIENIDPAPRRVTRSRVCKSANKQDPALVTNKETTNVMMDSESTVVVQSSSVGVDSDEPLKVRNNEILKKLSISNRRSGSTCRVSVEKIPLRLSTPAPENITIQPGTEVEKLTNVRLDTEPMALVETRDDLTDKTTQSPQTSPSTVEDIVPTMNPATSIISKVDALTISSTDTESDTEVTLARPTPPRPNLLKLKKKGGKRGGKGRTAKPKTRAAILKGKANTPVVETGETGVLYMTSLRFL